MKNKSFLFWFSLSLIWMGVIFAFSHQAYSGRISEEYLGEANIPVRKLAHMSEFGLLYFLYLKSLLSLNGALEPRAGRQRGWLALLLVFAYAASDEWHQSFVPGRSSQFNDVLVDMLGAVLTALFLILLGKLPPGKPGLKDPSVQ